MIVELSCPDPLVKKTPIIADLPVVALISELKNFRKSHILNKKYSGT